MAILIGMATLLGSAMPIFASASIDSFTSANLLIYTEQSFYQYPGNVTELKVPVYVRVSLNNTYDVQKYYSGYFYTGNENIESLFGTLNPSLTTATSPKYLRFEPSGVEGIYTYGYKGRPLRIYMDNYHPVSTGNFVLMVGYIVYSVPELTNSACTYTPSRNDVSISNQSVVIKATEYEYGFYSSMHDAIAEALEGNDNLMDILSALQDIRNMTNTYLPSFDAWLHDMEGNQDTIIQLMRDTLTTEQSINVTLSRFYTEYYNVVHASKDATPIQEDVEEKARISQSLAAGMAMDRPDLDAQDVNINDMIDQDVNTKFGIAVGSIFSNNFIVTMMMISVSAMIIGFVLYGKK